MRRALNGQGRVANDLYAPFDPTFNHALPPRAHDPQRAAQLLREAGQEHLRVELVTTAGPALASALVLAEQARRIGVTLDVRQVDSATFNGPQQDQWLLSTGGTIGAPFLASAMHTDAPFAVANKTPLRRPAVHPAVSAGHGPAGPGQAHRTGPPGAADPVRQGRPADLGLCQPARCVFTQGRRRGAGADVVQHLAF
ncbi:ABC transporter substrate-binding protein [Pseudomonas qingdaonensis]|nr:ABC transporter substrate-binding protein [Pseudomonas qingdaonensis]